MERAKSERSIARRLFTLCANELEKALSEKDFVNVSALSEKLSRHQDHLSCVQNKIINLWLDDEERDEAAFEADIMAADVYEKRWYVLGVKSREALKEIGSSENVNTVKSADESECSKSCRRKMKLPKFELPSFDGEVKNWISFWSQFKKIHEDQSDLTNDDKIHYLRQSMEKGSAAREFIESFPPCGENYEKAVSQLKQRFGKEEFIIEHYVRELLKLVVAKSSFKFSLRELYDKLMTQILALESLGLTQDKFAAFLHPMVESSLPDETLKAWNRSHFYTESKEKSLSKLLEFVRYEVESEEKIKMAHFPENHNSPSTSSAACLTTSVKKSQKSENEADVSKQKEILCVWCEKSSHVSSECAVAIKMTLEERKEFLKQIRACFLCLRKGHSARNCRRHAKCVICGKRHYALMCNDIPKAEKKESSPRQAVLSQAEPSKTVLLQTLKVNILVNNKVLPVRALLDSGAQRSFIRSSAAEKMNLKPVGEKNLVHNLFGGQVTKKQTYKVYDIAISSLDGAYSSRLTVLSQPVLCGYLPKIRDNRILTDLRSKGISLSDCFDDETEISLLIGSDVLGSFLTGRVERVDENLLAMETKLGWTLQGPVVGAYCALDEVNTLHASCSCDTSDFWRLETLGIRDEAEVKSQKVAESEVGSFFRSTIRIDDDDRYEVRLPWLENSKILEPNYNLALKRLNSTTSRVSRLGIVEEYDAAFREWLDSGIIEKVDQDDPQIGHYLPHHAVVRESSSTTKIRPVFDASALDQNGFSLNSCLEKGVNLIEMIPRLLTGFRKNEIGVTADIKKAFLQISLFPQDREYLKFLWWRDINESPRVLQTFRHRRVVFGVTTSPYLLSATILYHLEKYNSDTANLLKKSFYVDNCVVSVRNISEMNRFIEEAKGIMLDGKFELRCWVTGPELIDEDVITTSVLGLIWNPRLDIFTCKIPPYKGEKLTKRFLLSIAQSIFDPMGFLCPATIVPKIIIQKCWINNVDWDQTLPEDLAKPVQAWLSQMNALSECVIPRRLSIFDLSLSENSLHVFCDASQSAYACCIFLRSEYNSQVHVQLITAKSRVTPTKAITIPRIELLAALLASRLANEVRNSLELSCREYFWTDSSIVLAWLKKKSGFNVFVHNRVKEILHNTNEKDWYHVPGELNPADFPSRGCDPQHLMKSEWWNGPMWLKGSSSEWPSSVVCPEEADVVKELISSQVLAVQESETFTNRLLYFSNYNKIVRTVGWCLRFCHNARRRSVRLKGDLKCEEVQTAENRLISCLQKESFTENTLQNLKLEVLRDSNNLLRVQTRLTLSSDSRDFITPILLPRVEIVERLVALKHREYGHAGSQTLQAKLRELYWILGSRRIAKRTVEKCVICKRHSAKACTVPVPPLPTDRINCGAPFEVTGIDFAGPLWLRTGEKCWIALFTCATYRAIHLELCLSLSTEDFLLALRRFLARRGYVRIIYTDNGTNFKGASNIINSINWAETEKRANKIVWRFIPPAAPWWGGFWERMVRTLKDILKRMLGKALLGFNELVTVLCEAESLVNSRPLTYMPDSTDKLQALTPSNFLNFCKPMPYNIEISLLDGEILSSRWRYLQKLCGDLKQRFRSEYLSLLISRNVKNVAKPVVKPGDIVLLEVKDRKRVEWPLAIILDIREGRDGHSRVALIKTASGERLRAVQSLYPLEISAADSLATEGTIRHPQLGLQPTVTRSGRLVRVPDKFMA